MALGRPYTSADNVTAIARLIEGGRPIDLALASLPPVARSYIESIEQLAAHNACCANEWSARLSDELSKVAGLRTEAERLRGYWKPMASAPKDGDYFLIERDVPSINSMSIAFWHDGQNVPGFVHADSLGHAVDLKIYTIWRPLPRPALTPAQRNQIEACLAKDMQE